MDHASFMRMVSDPPFWAAMAFIGGCLALAVWGFRELRREDAQRLREAELAAETAKANARSARHRNKETQ